MTCAPMCTAYHFSSNLYSLKVQGKNLCGQNESYLKYSELFKKKKKSTVLGQRFSNLSLHQTYPEG